MGVLRETAHLLREEVRSMDNVSRWSGEEYMLVLPETCSGGAGLLAVLLFLFMLSIPGCYYQFSDCLGLGITE